ncbi:hypothetical protein [Paractinoplanes rishiriensis]|uniref:Uncharacterized protein n=1 Tax=Paractinoplanes rishiriensis TaxID=1050105 RepID=A0A919KA78_9ACTN|nr:hypothetical protein [Actinoplanes rishiriensis]GIF01570.1 hypothetical protein Ari01nite_90340 [Actinoplanes rishiriensis]
MPSPDVVPPRTKRREFVEEIFRLYRAAGSPPLREIEEWIRGNDELKGTASTETIRRILRGHVPPRWHTVEAIALAFFAMSDLQADEERYSENMGDSFSNMEALRRAWSEAIEEDPGAPDPRARRQAGNFDDEPPF